MNKKNYVESISLLKLLNGGILDSKRGILYGDNGFIVTDITFKEIRESDQPLFRFPTRLESYAVLLCAEGEFTMSCNLQQLTIGPQMAFFIKPGSIIQCDLTEDCRFSVILFEEALLNQMNLSMQKLLPHLGMLSQLSCISLTQEEFGYLNRQISMVAESIRQPTILSYYDEAIKASICTFAYSFMSILIREINSHKTQDSQIHTREEEIFRRFIQLVTEHYRYERKVVFYARLMHITPKYLSSLIRKVSGYGASKWIDDCVMLDAKNLLKYSSMSIQEIAFYLNFPNQSFFGRWFKDHTGMSPKAYRDSE